MSTTAAGGRSGLWIIGLVMGVIVLAAIVAGIVAHQRSVARQERSACEFSYAMQGYSPDEAKAMCS